MPSGADAYISIDAVRPSDQLAVKEGATIDFTLRLAVADNGEERRFAEDVTMQLGSPRDPTMKWETRVSRQTQPRALDVITWVGYIVTMLAALAALILQWRGGAPADPAHWVAAIGLSVLWLVGAGAAWLHISMESARPDRWDADVYLRGAAMFGAPVLLGAVLFPF